MFEGLVAQRLAALFVSALLLLNFPLLALWDHDLRVGGLPLFPLALFGIWTALIVTVAWIVERPGTASEPDTGD
ncbi:MAG: hypothetical protein ACLGG8_09455 [Gammaproteobacteria bacterium]